MPQIKYKDGHRAHVFECVAGQCKGRNSRYVYRFLDKGDANSTSNLLCHTKICWGAEVVESATATRDLDAAREVLAKTKLRDGSILTEFQWIGKGKVTYRHTQHTGMEATSGKAILAQSALGNHNFPKAYKAIQMALVCSGCLWLSFHIYIIPCMSLDIFQHMDNCLDVSRCLSAYCTIDCPVVHVTYNS